MEDPQSAPGERSAGTSEPGRTLLASALDQAREDSRLYNEAVGSYNTHLDNHRDRRDLHDVPFRRPVTAHDAFDDAMDGERTAIEALLTHLVDQAHLDSRLRRHPRTYPIHLEATEHLAIARERLVSTLEEALQHTAESGDEIPERREEFDGSRFSNE